MKNKLRIFSISLAVFFLLLFIIEPKTAADGMVEGIDVCLNVIIPSLFPFFVVTAYLNSNLSGYSIPGIRFISKALHLPNGCQMILPLTLMGGYPIGAKLITDMYKSKAIDKRTAHILMGYCNNAGPAFIIGIAGASFSSPIVAVILWILHIISAILTGLLLPKPYSQKADIPIKLTSMSQILKNSITSITSVCSWILVFKILLSYLNHWFHGIIHQPIGIILTGLLELSNGCIAIAQLPTPTHQFILFSVFFGFGGLCVLLQTLSVTDSMGIGLYVYGKVIQTCISLILSIIVSKLLFKNFPFQVPRICVMVCFSIMIIGLMRHRIKKLWKSDPESCIMQTEH